MNGTQQMNGRLTELYRSVTTSTLEGAFDQIRTRLAELTAELRSGTPQGQALPRPIQAANAVNLVINGKGNWVSIAQASDGGVATTSQEGVHSGFWTKARIVGVSIVGLATITATVIAMVQCPF
ncbi:hypothetical protein [Pseudoclavibacter sp. AY1H1]|uniref:hypothetical protein n=1 Tax=Pseudoclavibacter sp. AY1H1 TaxID=2080584 RepID=UPI000CE75CC8|nr:hypothetical protein [Pseudoclavibacter sp. AY1H1]PPF34953.1 hypothetical protein C5E05_13985 [Pseudoclavibacter sp. AY1H1]